MNLIEIDVVDAHRLWLASISALMALRDRPAPFGPGRMRP